MPLTGTPPTYTRGYSFTTHSIDQPNVPQPGDKLDQEFDDIATATAASAGAIDGITNADGTLANGIVGMLQLAPGLFDQILTDAQDQIQPMVDDAAASASTAQSWAGQAQSNAIAAATSANTAVGAISTTAASQAAAAVSAGSADADADRAEAAADASENSATTSSAAMSQSLAYKDLSFQWAENLAGPVAPAPPGWPEAVDDGMWSAKWWAVRAQDIVGQFGNFYLGPFPLPPVVPSTGPWAAGTLYYDTALGLMMVWTGSAWAPLTAPGPSIQDSFVYRAAANQQDFSGVDVFGRTPAMNAAIPEPVDVHVNGVRLVRGNATFGDYTVNAAASSIHINIPLTLDSVVQMDMLLPPSSLAPMAIFAAHKIKPLAPPFNGVLTDFPMLYNAGAGDLPVTADTGGVQLQIVLDGVLQESGADYVPSGSTLHFTQPPPTGTRFAGVWYQPGA